ncbi:MAG: ankyrin repeat domain-containing protein [Rickettsiales bacterium]
MKIKQKFRDIERPRDIKDDALSSYLANLYKNASITKSKSDILIDELIRLTGDNKFEVLRSKLSQFVVPGETKRIISDLKKTAEAICYKIANNLLEMPERFKSETKSASIRHCDAGALTNMQKILLSMDASLYAQKYDYIHNLASEYIRENNLADVEVHKANELIHEVSQAYNIIPPRDVYVTYRNLSEAPTKKFEKNAQFKDYIDQHFASRDGIYGFSEFVANTHLSNLPDAPASNQKFKSKVNDNESEQLEQIGLVVENLGITLTSIINYSEDGSEFEYKPDYMSIIKAAVMQDLIKQEMIEHEPLVIRDIKTSISYAPPRREKDEFGKTIIIYDREGTSSTIEINNQIIESSDGWYLTETIADKVVPSKKILDTAKLKGLTIGGVKIEDYLHEQLRNPLKAGMSFEDSLRSVIGTNENRVEVLDADINKELILLSDQASTLKGLLSREELSSMSTEDRSKWIELGHLMKNNSLEILPYLARNANKHMFDTYLRVSKKTKEQLISWRDQDNNNLLNLAAYSGNNALVVDLIELGGDTKLKAGATNSTALHCAAYTGHVEVILTLIAKGIDIDAKDKYGFTALCHAAFNGETKIVTKLVELGADINAKSDLGLTALYNAAFNGKNDTILKLIELGADINAKSNLGLTALHGAALNRKYKTITQLIELGANLNIRKTFMGSTFLNQIIKDVSLHEPFIEGIKNSKNTAPIIIDLVKESSGWFYDNKNAWNLIEKVVKDPNFNEDKIKIVTQVLNKTNNESRRNKLLSFLDKNEIASVKANMKPIETLWQKILKVAGYSAKENIQPAIVVKEALPSFTNVSYKEIPTDVKEQAADVAKGVHRHSSVSSASRKIKTKTLQRRVSI